ncbi:MAG: zinc ribbon domain-containing protein [Armatimonadota bacterium]|nr:zinc ribbon domain-containing protein [Armatimonadota bacterium]
MEQHVYCPKCAAEVSDPKQPCPRCGHVIEHPQRQRFRRQVVASAVTTLLGYALGMLGLLLRWEVVGIAGLVMGFVGGVWFMVSLYLWLRTGV